MYLFCNIGLYFDFLDLGFARRHSKTLLHAQSP